ncbi:hypothetical protein FHT08_001307 [Xanthomonas campestris]|nr:hypothetical protein [Xanthomonas sp. CFBP 8151]
MDRQTGTANTTVRQCTHDLDQGPSTSFRADAGSFVEAHPGAICRSDDAVRACLQTPARRRDLRATTNASRLSTAAPPR